jgi:hypothetical protein
MIDIFRRNPQDIRSCANSGVSLFREHGLSHWMAFGRILEGWAAVNEGETDHGIKLFRAGVAAWREAGARLWLPLFLALEAEVYAREGRIAAALEVIEQESVSPRTGEHLCLAEILRVKAGLPSEKPIAQAIKSRFYCSRASRLPGLNRPAAGSCARLVILPRSGNAAAGQEKQCGCCSQSMPSSQKASTPQICGRPN